MNELPEYAKKLLIDLRAAKPQDLHDYVKALRGAEWPLRAIAEVLGVSRTAVSNWESKGVARERADVPSVGIVPASQRTRVSKKYTPSGEETEQLQSLSSQAKLVRRFTDANAASRRASAELDSLLVDLHERGTTLRDLATLCGVSRASISERIRNT